MTQPDDSIPYNAEKVLHRAYARIGDLTMQVDQLVVALESAHAQLIVSTGDTPAP